MQSLRDDILAELRQSFPPKLEKVWEEASLEQPGPEERASFVRHQLLTRMNEVMLDASDPGYIDFGIIRMPLAVQVIEEWLARKLKECQ